MLRGDVWPPAAVISPHDSYLTPIKMTENADFIQDFSFLDVDFGENLEDLDSSFSFNDISLLNCSSESLLDLCCSEVSDPCHINEDVVDTGTLKEDFNRVLDEWQSHISGLDRPQLGLDTSDCLLPEDLEFLIGTPEPSTRPTEVVQRVVCCDSSEDEEIDVVSVDEAAVNPFRSTQIVPVDVLLGTGKQYKPAAKVKIPQETKNAPETKKKIPPLLIKKEHNHLNGESQPRMMVSLLTKANQPKAPVRHKRSILIACPSPPSGKKSGKSKSTSSTRTTCDLKPDGEVFMEDHDYCTTSAPNPSCVSPVNQNAIEFFNKIPDYICDNPAVECEVVVPFEDVVPDRAPFDEELYNKLPPYMTGLTIATPVTEDAQTKNLEEFGKSDWKTTSVSKLFERRYRSVDSPASSSSSPSRSRSTSHDREGSYSRSNSPSSNGSSCYGDSRPAIDRRKHRRTRRDSSSWDRGTKRCKTKIMEEEKLQQIDDRRIIYVGNMERSITRADLRRRFSRFGPIEEISIHNRHNGNYGFVTFEYRVDAVDAIEHGNDNPNLPKYDLNFGGRRQFCRSDYKDLDSAPRYSWNKKKVSLNASSLDFDSLLQATKSLLKTQKKTMT